MENNNAHGNTNTNSNGNGKIKKVGTREEVFKGMALRTAGGLIKNDIIEKQFNNKTLYISKKLSEKMRLSSNIPGLFKRQPKQTIRNIQHTSANTNSNNTNTSNANTNTNNSNTNNSNTKTSNTNNNNNSNTNPKHNKNGKTQKLSFKVCDNTIKTIYYPELHGMDLEELKKMIF